MGRKKRVEERGWNNIKDWMSNSHSWECIFAKREKKSGGAKEGFIIEKRKGWSNNNCELIAAEGVVVSIIGEEKREKETEYMIVSVYNERNNWGNIEDVIKRMMEEHKKDYVM